MRTLFQISVLHLLFSYIYMYNSRLHIEGALRLVGNYTVTTIIQMQGSRRLAKAQVHNTTAQQTVILQTVHIFPLHALVAIHC